MAPGKSSGQQRLTLYAILLAATIGCISAGNHRPTNCEVVKEKVCSNYFNKTFCSHFPTSTRDLSMEDTISEFSHFLRLLNLDNYCSYLLHTFLCYYYYPVCTLAENPLLPCRELCEEVFDECLTKIYKTWRISPPEHLNCSRFPTALSCPTICPPPAVHFHFLSSHEKCPAVVESNGSVEICIELVSTGGGSNLSTAVKIDLQACSESAKAGSDYYELEKSYLEFPVGSIKGTKKCFNVTIIDDTLSEKTETFHVHAMAYGGAMFGRALNSSNGVIKVKIFDDDECIIPEIYCNAKCSQRTNVGKNTFKQNNYTYVAHIRSLGMVSFTNCTAIRVLILSFRNLTDGSCYAYPTTNTVVTIPTCSNCPRQQVTEGGEYAIAGIHHCRAGAATIILPGRSRKEGLLASWSDKIQSIFYGKQ